MSEITYRPLTAADIGHVPMDCHGGAETLAARIADLGSAAILAFDGGQHVGQLQFRRHDPALVSARGLFEPDYWGDFGGRGPALPRQTLGVFCYHVGQLTDGQERDARYQGRGIGLALLDQLIGWAGEHGFEAIVAKSVPPDRAVMGWMGGQPAAAYEARGFETAAAWEDAQLYEVAVERGLIAAGADRSSATVGMCVKRL